MSRRLYVHQTSCLQSCWSYRRPAPRLGLTEKKKKKGKKKKKSKTKCEAQDSKSTKNPMNHAWRHASFILHSGFVSSILSKPLIGIIIVLLNFNLIISSKTRLSRWDKKLVLSLL
jgi:hypothetical protein